MFIVYILCKNRKIFYRGCFCAFLAGYRSHLLSFYCSNLLAFPPFLFGADFFCRKERCFRPILYRPFLYRPILRADSQKTPRPHERAPRKKPREPVALLNAHLEIPTQKARRARRAFTARLYLACRRAQKAPIQKSRKGERPPRKNPGSKSQGFG